MGVGNFFKGRTFKLTDSRKKEIEKLLLKATPLSTEIGRGYTRDYIGGYFKEKLPVHDEKLKTAVEFVEKFAGKEFGDEFYVVRKKSLRIDSVVPDGKIIIKLPKNASAGRCVYSLVLALDLSGDSPLRQKLAHDGRIINPLNVQNYSYLNGRAMFAKGAYGDRNWYANGAFHTAAFAGAITALTILFQFTPVLKQVIDAAQPALDRLYGVLSLNQNIGDSLMHAINATFNWIDAHTKFVNFALNFSIRGIVAKTITYLPAAIFLKSMMEWLSYMSVYVLAKKVGSGKEAFRITAKAPKGIADVFFAASKVPKQAEKDGTSVLPD